MLYTRVKVSYENRILKSISLESTGRAEQEFGLNSFIETLGNADQFGLEKRRVKKFVSFQEFIRKEEIIYAIVISENKIDASKIQCFYQHDEIYGGYQLMSNPSLYLMTKNEVLFKDIKEIISRDGLSYHLINRGWVPSLVLKNDDLIENETVLKLIIHDIDLNSEKMNFIKKFFYKRKMCEELNISQLKKL